MRFLGKPLPIWLLPSPFWKLCQSQPYFGEHPTLFTGRAASPESNGRESVLHGSHVGRHRGARARFRCYWHTLYCV